jgi:hypothetical protein
MNEAHEIVDALRSDMATHQARSSVEVTDAANHVIATQIAERVAREQADAKPFVPMPHAFDEPRPPTRQERRRVQREGKHGVYTIDATGRDDIGVRKANEGELWFFEHAMPRIKKLLTEKDTGPLGQPSWADRTWAVMQLCTHANDLQAAGFHAEANNFRRRYGHELFILLEDSSRSFGDWKRDPDHLVMVG